MPVGRRREAAAEVDRWRHEAADPYAKANATWRHGRLLGARGQVEAAIEAFALAKDRKIPLAQLIPGTEDYYYFHALQRQTEGRSA